MFQAGDYVICRSGGVWRISAADGNAVHLCRRSNGTQRTIEKDSNEIVRKISSKETLQEAIDRIPFIRTIQAPNDKVRKAFYEEAMAKFDELEWISVIKSVYLRRQDQRLMEQEPAYEECAKEYLHGEISILFDIPMDQVEKYIAETVTNDEW